MAPSVKKTLKRVSEQSTVRRGPGLRRGISGVMFKGYKRPAMWQIQVRSFWAKGPASTKAPKAGRASFILRTERKTKWGRVHRGLTDRSACGVKTGSLDFISFVQ